jgi:excisionase family DNA binding protein
MYDMAANSTLAPVVLSVPQVAQIIGRTELATRRAIERGTIPARKFGRRVIVLRGELDEYLSTLPRRARPHETVTLEQP